MELVDKKEHIIRCIKLGMDQYSSCIISQCTEEELKLLDEDKVFKQEVLFTQKLQERDLLEQHSEASLIAGMKGNTHGFEWRLERMNPEQFGKRPNSIVNVNQNVGVEVALTEEEEEQFEKNMKSLMGKDD